MLGQDHQTWHPVEKAADVLDDRNRGLEQQLVRLRALQELVFAETASHRHRHIDAQRHTPLPLA
jgi:hypothetical protein